jgi:uncharacterized protein involved in exopolysaccharide biosynthesis
MIEQRNPTLSPPDEERAWAEEWTTARTPSFISRLTRRDYYRLLGALLLGAALGAGVAQLRGRRYVAHASFVSQEKKTGAANIGADIASQLGVSQLADLIGGSEGVSAAFYVQLMKSQWLVTNVLQTKYTATTPKPFSGTLLEYYDIDPREADAIRRGSEKFAKTVSVALDRPSGIISVEVTTKSPELSTGIARRIIALIGEFNQQRRRTQGSAERTFAGRRVAEALDSLHMAESALSAFRERNRSFGQAPQLQLEETRLQRALQISQQVYTSLVQRYEMARVDEVRDTPLVTVIDDPAQGAMPLKKVWIPFALLGALAGLAAAFAYIVRRKPSVDDELVAAPRRHV